MDAKTDRPAWRRTRPSQAVPGLPPTLTTDSSFALVGAADGPDRIAADRLIELADALDRGAPQTVTADVEPLDRRARARLVATFVGSAGQPIGRSDLADEWLEAARPLSGIVVPPDGSTAVRVVVLGDVEVTRFSLDRRDAAPILTLSRSWRGLAASTIDDPVADWSIEETSARCRTAAGRLQSPTVSVRELERLGIAGMLTSPDSGAKVRLEWLSITGDTLEATEAQISPGAWDIDVWPSAGATGCRVVLIADKADTVFSEVTLRRTTATTTASPRTPRSLIFDDPILDHVRHRRDPGAVRELGRQRELAELYQPAAADECRYSFEPFRRHPFLFETPAGTASLRVTLDLSAARVVTRIGEITLRQLADARQISVPGSRLRRNDPGTQQWQSAESDSVVVIGHQADVHGIDTAWIQRAAGVGSAQVTLNQSIPVDPESGYSLGFAIQQFGIADQGGTSWQVEFLDASGEQIDTRVSTPYNWDTHTRWDSPLFDAMQADAAIWALNRDAEAAVRAIARLRYAIDESIWGMRNVITYGVPRPNGEDGYGAVHFGRALGGYAIVLDLIGDAPTLDAPTRAHIVERLGWMRDTMMNPVYYPRDDDDAARLAKTGSTPRRSNWNTDRACGVGMAALATPESTSAAADLAHAIETIEWQLREVVGDDGSWPETIRYHAAVLNRLLPFAAMLDRTEHGGFATHPRLLAMLEFLVATQSPPDRVTTVREQERDGEPIIVPPSIGDSEYRDNVYRQCGVAAGLLQERAPGLAAGLQWTWLRAGAPTRDDGAHPYPLVPLALTDGDRPAHEVPLGNDIRRDIGYLLVRPRRDDLLIVSAAEHPLGHDHADRSSFSLWSDGVPLVLDSGVGEYFNGDRQWYVGSAAHNVVQLQDPAGGWADNAPTAHLLAYDSTTDGDRIHLRLDASRARRNERLIVVHHAAAPIYVIADVVEGNLASRWNLHTLSRRVTVMPDGFTAHCSANRRLDVHLPLTDRSEPDVTVGALCQGFTQDFQHWIRVDAGPNVGHLAVLRPGDADAARAVVRIDGQTLLITADDVETRIDLDGFITQKKPA